MYPSQKAEKLLLRFPPGLKAVVKEKAAQSRRTLTNEIIFQLESAYGLLGKDLIAEEGAATSDGASG